MPAGPQAAYDRCVTLLSGYAMAAASHGVAALREAEYDFALSEEPSLDLHRRFQVIYDTAQAIGGEGGQFSGDLLDDILNVRVQVSYFMGGGTRTDSGAGYEANRSGIDSIAADDMNRVRQRLCHPDNWSSSTTGIQIIHWQGTRNIVRDHRRQLAVYEASFGVQLRHAVISGN